MEKRDEGGDSLKTKRHREIERLTELCNKRPLSDDGFDFQGVLLSDAIERCVQAFDLIKPFNPDNLKAACYKLTVGDEYALGGEIHSLSDEPGKNEIKIAPFEVAIIKTHETINMPRFLIGRWNIQVSRAYQGLIWVGGPQVDAGYVGHLFCPIYNLSNQHVSIFKGQAIAVIDFVRTTEFHPKVSKEYKCPPDRVLFEDYEPQKLVSGLVSQAKERLDKVEENLRANAENTQNQIKETKQRVDNFVSLTFAVVAILFAAISLSAFGGGSPPWLYIGLVLFCSLTIFCSASAWLKSRSEGQLFGRTTQVIVLAGLTLAFFLQLWWILDQRKQIDRLDNEIRDLKAARPISTGAPPKTIEPQTEVHPPDSKESAPNKAKP